jgi:hypothetical protein
MLPGDPEALAAALADTVTSASLDLLHGVYGAGVEFGDPRYQHAAEDGWQQERGLLLRQLLVAAGVTVWDGELPPLC